MDAFYGRASENSDAMSDSGDDLIKKCDAALVQRYIHRAHKFANALIAEDEQIDGTVDNLIVNDVQMTATALTEEEEDILDDPEECLDNSDIFSLEQSPSMKRNCWRTVMTEMTQIITRVTELAT